MYEIGSSINKGSGNITTSARRRLKEWARRVKKDILALTVAYKDPRVPWYARVLIVGILGYAFSPIDLIPDFIPVLGLLDDLILLPLGIMLAIKLTPPIVMQESRLQAERMLEQRKPSSWRGALGIIFIWLLCASLVVLWFLRWH